MRIKSLLKSIYFFISDLLKTTTSLFAILFFSSFRTKFVCNNHLKDATLIVNGPSVNDVLANHRHLFKNTDVMVVNSFIVSDYFWILKPKYYIIMDPVFFVSDYVVESEETAPPSVSEANRMLSLTPKIDWNMIFFIPYGKITSNYEIQLKKNTKIKVLHFNCTRIEGFDKFQFWAYNHGLGIPSSRNIIIPSLINLINLGYKTIYVYGAEFSWTRTMDINPANGKMFFNDRHFYSESEIRYFGQGGFLWWLKAICEMLIGVEQISKFAILKKTVIINRTKGSFIDSFQYENPDLL